ISSEMLYQRPEEQNGADDPRQAKFAGKSLHPLGGHSAGRRLVLVHSTERSQMTLACGIDHDLQSEFPHEYNSDQTENSGRVVFTIKAEPRRPIHLTKYMVYHSAKAVNADEIGRRADWTLDRVVSEGFPKLLADQEQYMDQFWRRSDVQVSNVKAQ